MKALFYLLLSFVFVACAQESEAGRSNFTDSQELVVAEFRKFHELELIDCIAGWDTAIYQAEQGEINLENLEEQKQVMKLMLEALQREVDEPIAVKDLHPKSSFHVSGIYLTDDEHADYQEKLITSCTNQLKRIANLVNSKAAE